MRFRIFLIALLLFVSSGTASSEIVPKKVVMKNGLTVLLIERHSLPIVSVVALIKAGSINDPQDRAGMANLTASLLDEGTTSRSSVQIADEIDFIGGSIGASAGKDSTTASLKVLKKDIEKGFDLFSDILLHPLFDPQEMERVRDLILGSIHSEKDDPMIIADRSFEQLIFGNHPYRNPVIGVADTVKMIRREEILSFYQSHYTPENALLSIVGDINEKEVVQLVERYFGTWQRKSPSQSIALPPPPTLQPKKNDLIDKATVQSSVLMGHVGIDRKNPDFFPVVVMNYILGEGGFSSRLMKEIRDNLGLVYSVYSSFDVHRQRGSFSIALQTKTSNANKAIRAVISEVRKFLSNGVSETELMEAKSYLAGSFPLRLETTDRLSAILATIGFYELGLNYFQDYPQQIEKVTQADVLRVANRYLHPDQFTLVVVGNLAEAKIATPD